MNLALQGGGAHGAFTWGALERLLEDDGIDIGRISGASAGALNGAALATGLAAGGRAGAKDNLAKLWRQVIEAGALMSLLQVPLRKPGLGIWDDAMPLLSPYQTNPLAMEPLRRALASVVDVNLLKRDGAPPLYVNAVNVNTGQTRVFGPDDLSVEALLASACAPLMFQAVQIEGASYWDGSYAGNPMLWPLHDGRLDTDILLVELMPMQRSETPTTAKNILNRINEITSINGLVSEIRAIDRVNRGDGGSTVRLHVLSLPDAVALEEVEPSTKRTVDYSLFESLRLKGYVACGQWLGDHRDAIGIRSSVDMAARYLAPYGAAAIGMS